jgi:hypothetical protein
MERNDDQTKKVFEDYIHSVIRVDDSPVQFGGKSSVPKSIVRNQVSTPATPIVQEARRQDILAGCRYLLSEGKVKSIDFQSRIVNEVTELT